MTSYEPMAQPLPKATRVLSLLALIFGIVSLFPEPFGTDFALAGIILANLSALPNRDIMTKRAKTAQTLSIIGAAISFLFWLFYCIAIAQLMVRLPLFLEELTSNILYYMV